MSTEVIATHEFFAACPRHVSELLAAELRSFGLEVTREHPAGVGFRGPWGTSYPGNLRLDAANLTEAQWPVQYWGANYARLQATKRRVDPQDFFRGRQTVRLPPR